MFMNSLNIIKIYKCILINNKYIEFKGLFFHYIYYKDKNFNYQFKLNNYYVLSSTVNNKFNLYLWNMKYQGILNIHAIRNHFEILNSYLTSIKILIYKKINDKFIYGLLFLSSDNILKAKITSLMGSYLFVISAIHFKYFFSFLKFLNKNKYIALISSLTINILFTLYLLLLNFNIPFLRVYLMVGINMLLKYCNIHNKFLKNNLPAFVMLFFNPFILFNFSFLLTFGYYYYFLILKKVNFKKNKLIFFLYKLIYINILSILISIFFANSFSIFFILSSTLFLFLIEIIFTLSIISIPFLLMSVNLHWLLSFFSVNFVYIVDYFNIHNIIIHINITKLIDFLIIVFLFLFLFVQVKIINKNMFKTKINNKYKLKKSFCTKIKFILKQRKFIK